MQADLGIDRVHILEYARSVISVVVQLKKNFQGNRVASEIKYNDLDYN